jgi:hypothetical protein
MWASTDAYYNIGGETGIYGVGQHNAADTLRLGPSMGLTVWAGGEIGLNYERAVAKPAGQPHAQAIRVTIRQVW